MSDAARAILDRRQERAVLDLSVAARRVRVAAGAPASIRAEAREHLERAEAVAKEWGVLPTQEEIVAERRFWARRLLVGAYQKVRFALDVGAEPEALEACEVAVRDAMFIAQEWGLDPRAVVRAADRGARS